MIFEEINIEPIAWLLVDVVSAGATDLLLAADTPPRMRVDGRLSPIPGEPVLTDEDVSKMVLGMLPEKAQKEFFEEKEYDFSFTYETSHRFRGNCFVSQGTVSLALRSIPLAIPSPEELRLPPIMSAICELPQGFVLVTGPTGSGKSTTLASLIDYINRRRPLHILTIEDPIEYVHQHKVAAVNQREVGLDTNSFANALRSALREDPDVILVGEMRDPETIQFALTLAETGHLVFATLHTNDAAQALDRISDVFPPERQTQIKVQLAASLTAVVSQRLIPKVDGGLIAAFEVLLANMAVRNLIREGRSHQLRNIMQGGKAEGMLTLEASLNGLIEDGFISYEEALSRSMHEKELKRPQPMASVPMAPRAVAAGS